MGLDNFEKLTDRTNYRHLWMPPFKSLYINNRSCIFLEGRPFEFFSINHGVAQGCTLSPTLFLICING